jgi:hypothetical protein
MSLDQVALKGFSCGRGPRWHPELAVDGAQVLAYGTGAQVESLCYLRVGESVCNEREAEILALGE